MRDCHTKGETALHRAAASSEAAAILRLLLYGNFRINPKNCSISEKLLGDPSRWLTHLWSHAIRFTRDIDLAINRHDLHAIRAALGLLVFTYRHVARALGR